MFWCLFWFERDRFIHKIFSRVVEGSQWVRSTHSILQEWHDMSRKREQKLALVKTDRENAENRRTKTWHGFSTHTHVVKGACFVYNFILCKDVSKSVEMFCFQQGNIELPEKCKWLAFISSHTNTYHISIQIHHLPVHISYTKHDNTLYQFESMNSMNQFLFELFKKDLESICCPSYEMNAGSWQAWVLKTWCMQCMNMEQNNKLL